MPSQIPPAFINRMLQEWTSPLIVYHSTSWGLKMELFYGSFSTRSCSDPWQLKILGLPSSVRLDSQPQSRIPWQKSLAADALFGWSLQAPKLSEPTIACWLKYSELTSKQKNLKGLTWGAQEVFSHLSERWSFSASFRFNWWLKSNFDRQPLPST